MSIQLEEIVKEMQVGILGFQEKRYYPMVLRDQLAKTYSRIDQTLKLSKHDPQPLSYIVQVIREHFQGELCSLHEYRREILTLLAIDEDASLFYKMEACLHQELMEFVARSQEAFFTQQSALVPLIYQKKLVGILTLQRNQLSDFDLPERHFLEFIALQVAVVFQALTIAERAKETSFILEETSQFLQLSTQKNRRNTHENSPNSNI